MFYTQLSKKKLSQLFKKKLSQIFKIYRVKNRYRCNKFIKKNYYITLKIKETNIINWC